MALSEDYIKKIVTDLKKTGFHAELELRRIFARHGKYWDPVGTFPYIDKDEHKLRQIDMYAVMPCGDHVTDDKSTHTVWSLAIEVKKSEKGKPWIILKERQHVIRDVMLWQKDLVSYCYLPVEWEKNFSWRIPANSYYKDKKWRCFGVHESFRAPTDLSRPYAAMISTIKAAEYFHTNNKTIMKNSPTVTDDIKTNPSKVYYIRPVVVFDGELLCVETDKSGQLHITEIDMAPIEVNYKSEHYTQQDYTVDLVRLSAFDQYMTHATDQHNEIRKAILELGGLDPKIY